jgi:prepilin-type processing-associated H-X9-DG protein
VPRQFFEVLGFLLTGLLSGNFSQTEVLGADQDRDVAPGFGNGGPGVSIASGYDTVYRLREGIERFLITDINNPAASAKAQSEIWIMGDTVATNIVHYNHIPGGSNFLYMDGHVEFLRYPSNGIGPAPVNDVVAAAIGIITQSGDLGN